MAAAAAVVFLLLAVAASAPNAQATQVRRLNLEEMIDRAGRIVVGRCESVQVTEHPGIGTVTTINLMVEQTLKGEEERLVTVRMPGGELPGRWRSEIAGMPRFREGEELVLFLYPESEAGLTSPVGLGQGKFLTVRDKNGREVVRNALGNRGLAERLSREGRRRLGPLAAAADEPASIEPATLVKMIEELWPIVARGRKAERREVRP